MQNISSDSEILNICLEQIECGQATPESCIQRYPRCRELRDLLSAASIVRELPLPKLNPARRSAIEQKMLSRLKQTQVARTRQVINAARPSPHFASTTARQSGGWVRRFASAAFILVMVFFTGSAGLVQAASSAIPGDTLYTIKRSVEEFQLSAVDTQSIPDVLGQIAEARLNEMMILSDRGTTLDDAFVDEAMISVREAVVALQDYQKRDLLLWHARTTFVYVGERGAIQPEKQTLLVTMLDTVSDGNLGSTTPNVSNTYPDDTVAYDVAPTSTSISTVTYTSTFTETPTEEMPTNTATVAATLTKTPNPSKTSKPKPTAMPTRKPHPVQPTQPANGGNNGGGNGNGNTGSNGNPPPPGGNNGGGNSNGNGNGGGNPR